LNELPEKPTTLSNYDLLDMLTMVKDESDFEGCVRRAIKNFAEPMSESRLESFVRAVVFWHKELGPYKIKEVARNVTMKGQK
jgi:hypothetical protein